MKNIIIGLKDLRQNTQAYINQVAQGKSFLVIKKTKPVFRLSPVEDDEDWEEVIDFTKIRKGGVDIDDLLSRL